MEVSEWPEVKLARKIVSKYSLTPPINTDKIVEQFATLVYDEIPFEGIDGVCVELKVPGKKPTVIVNSNMPPTRQRFTLAHELGHLIIPWHIGTIVDETKDGESDASNEQQYWEMEREANRFAAEFLMPKDWVCSRFARHYNFQTLIAEVALLCQVSEQAAQIRVRHLLEDLYEVALSSTAIVEEYNTTSELDSLHEKIARQYNVDYSFAAERIVKTLPGPIVCTCEKGGIVKKSLKTPGNYFRPQYEGETFNPNQFRNVRDYFRLDTSDHTFHWWRLSSHANVDDSSDPRDWKEILDKIADDIKPAEGKEAFKRSINGKLSGAHGSLKNKGLTYTLDEIVSNFVQRLDNQYFQNLVDHADFKILLTKRARAFLK